MSFNRIARPDEWTLIGLLKDPHPLVTPEILEGQHPIRAWEYSQALKALDLWIGLHDPLESLLIADIGGAGSNFWHTFRHYTTKPATAIDPNHVWSSAEEAALFFRDTLSAFKQQNPDQRFDAVFCLSVIEHVPSKELQQFERDLCSLVKPGGLLVLTCDVGEKHPDVCHFYWMRERIYTPAGLAALAIVLQGMYGMQPLTPPAFRWEGPTVYDYTVGCVAMVNR